MAARPRFASRAQAFGAVAALARACTLTGGRVELARHLGVTLSSVKGWTFCPEHRVAAVSAASGVPPHELRPDLHPAPAHTAESAMAAHLAAGAHFARTGFTLSVTRAR